MSGRVWEVVGGADKGGIVVRAGRDLKSRQSHERLSNGALLTELGLDGDRLWYRKLSGYGPEYGWVSTQLKGKDLVVPHVEEDDLDDVPAMQIHGLTSKTTEEVPPKECKACGCAVEANARFCAYCGDPVQAPVATPAPAVPPTQAPRQASAASPRPAAPRQEAPRPEAPRPQPLRREESAPTVAPGVVEIVINNFSEASEQQKMASMQQREDLRGLKPTITDSHGRHVDSGQMPTLDMFPLRFTFKVSNGLSIAEALAASVSYEAPSKSQQQVPAAVETAVTPASIGAAVHSRERELQRVATVAEPMEPTDVEVGVTSQKGVFDGMWKAGARIHTIRGTKLVFQNGDSAEIEITGPQTCVMRRKADGEVYSFELDDDDETLLVSNGTTWIRMPGHALSLATLNGDWQEEGLEGTWAIQASGKVTLNGQDLGDDYQISETRSGNAVLLIKRSDGWVLDMDLSSHDQLIWSLKNGGTTRWIRPSCLQDASYARAAAIRASQRSAAEHESLMDARDRDHEAKVRAGLVPNRALQDAGVNQFINQFSCREEEETERGRSGDFAHNIYRDTIAAAMDESPLPPLRKTERPAHQPVGNYKRQVAIADEGEEPPAEVEEEEEDPNDCSKQKLPRVVHEMMMDYTQQDWQNGLSAGPSYRTVKSNFMTINPRVAFAAPPTGPPPVSGAPQSETGGSGVALPFRIKSVDVWPYAVGSQGCFCNVRAGVRENKPW